MTDTNVRYTPKEISPPGETIAEILEERGMTQVDLARRMGRSEKTISLVINGKSPISTETAGQLEMVLGTPASYWLSHEAQYQASRMHLLDEQKKEEWYDWVKRLPLKEMKQLGILPNLTNSGRNRDVLLRKALQFFGVNSPAQWVKIYGEMELANRLSVPQRSDKYARAVWLRLGELEFAKQTVSQYSQDKFRAALCKIRELTARSAEELLPLMRSLCADAGVMLITTPAIPRALISGAARWINNIPLVQLSLEGESSDRFWLSFFHEAGYILGGQRNLIYIDYDQNVYESEAVQQADAFAPERF